MDEYGILFNTKGVDSTEEPDYDSTRRTITVDLSPAREHAQNIELDGGTIWTRPAGSGTEEWSEVIWEFKHGLKFKPKVYSFYYVYDIPHDRLTSAVIGSYTPDKLWAITGAFFYGYESYETEVDEEYVRIVHKAGATDNLFSEFQGNGNLIKFRFRLLVTQLEDLSL